MRCRSIAAWRCSPAFPRRREQARLEHRLVSILPVDARFSAGEYAQLAHAEIDGLLADGRAADRRGRHRACTCAPRSPTSTCARPRPTRSAGAGRRSSSGAVRRPCTPSSRGGRRGRRRTVEPRDRSRLVRYLELDELGELEPPSGPNRLWTTETRHPTRLIGLTMQREALYARIDARVEAMVAAGAVRGGPRGARGRGLGDRAQGAGLRRAPRGRPRSHAAAHAQPRPSPAHLDAQARGRRARRPTTGRAPEERRRGASCPATRTARR